MADSWINMFDAGACEVSILRNDGTLTWRGALAKGDSSPVQTDSGTSAQWQVSVTSDGQVVVTSSVDNSFGNSDMAYLEVDVHPQYDVSTLQRKVDTMRAENSAGPAYAATSDDAQTESGAHTPITVNGANTDSTPDQVVFTPSGSSIDDVFVGMGWTGYG